MNVLSLFDGMSCGQQALERAGIKVENYFASEIDKYAIQVTMANYPNTKQLGSVVNLNGFDLPKIDLLIGGSPCQSFSFAGKRKGMSTKDEQEILTLEHYLQLKAEAYEFEGQSYLFWEYMRLLNETKPKYFLLENVKMSKKWKDILSKAIGVEPILINSNLVSAQNRQRLYWTNIGLNPIGLYGDLQSIIEQPEDKGIFLKDILQDNPNAKFNLSDKGVDRVSGYNNADKSINLNDKAICLTAGYNKQGRDNQYIPVDEKYYLKDDFKNSRLKSNLIKHKDKLVDGALLDSYNQSIFFDKSITITTRTIPSNQTHIIKINKNKDIKNRIRRLTPLECERLQTVKDNYTNFVSDSKRYRMIGNGWTVDIITHIFKYI
jgi:DNA (cytosine-5)-methyltransferase 3A